MSDQIIFQPLGKGDLPPGYFEQEMLSPVAGVMGGGFGDTRPHGKHLAGDLEAPAGTSVVAPGNMEFIEGRKGGRNLRDNDWWSHWRDTDTGREYRFAHHGDISKYKPGQQIAKGEQWGEVGNAIKGTHLHMAVRDSQGNPVDWMSPLKLTRGEHLASGSTFAQIQADNLERRASKIAGPGGGIQFEHLSAEELQAAQQPQINFTPTAPSPAATQQVPPGAVQGPGPQPQAQPGQPEMVPGGFGGEIKKASLTDDYDYKSAAIAGIKPDKSGHWQSRVGGGENEGLILKSETHPTFDKTIMGEAAAGNVFYRNQKTGKRYSFPPDAKLSADFVKEEKYQPIMDRAHEEIRSGLEKAAMAGAPEAAPTPPGTGQELARVAAPMARPVLEYGGLAAGEAAGVAAGIPTGGAASLVLGAAGGALGYAGGKKAADALEAYAGQKPIPTMGESLIQSGKDLATGVTIATAGQVGGKVLQKGLELGGKVIRPVLGKMSGTGTGAVEEALKGSKDFVRALRGKITGEEVVENAQSALQSLRSSRSTEYQTKLAEITKNKAEVDLQPLYKKSRDLMKQYNVKLNPDGSLDTSRIAMGKKGRNDIEDILETIRQWGTKPEDKTVLGLDTLKRQLDDFYSDSSQARGFVTNLKKEVVNLINKNEPKYAEMTKGYAEATKLIKDIESGLMTRKQGMSGRVTADQTLRRLTSSMRDNFELRRDLVNTLGNQSGEDIAGQVAGYAMSQVLPRGLAGTGPALIGEAALAKLVSPAFWPVLVASSPRVQGEFLQLYGKTIKEMTGFSIPVARVTAYFAGKKAEEESKSSRKTYKPGDPEIYESGRKQP